MDVCGCQPAVRNQARSGQLVCTIWAWWVGQHVKTGDNRDDAIFLFQYNRCKSFSPCASSMIWKRGWLQWLAKMNSYHCGRSLWEMGLPNMQEWLHAKSICKNVFVFVKFQNCFPNWQIDRYVLRWGGDLLNLQKWIPRKWKVKVFF